MPRMRPLPELLNQVGQAGTPYTQVGRVDLRNIAQADDFRILTGPCDQVFHLFWAQVLTLIDYQDRV